MTLSAFGLTDVGRKRRHNEDAYLLDIERGLFVVADGMGGHAAGEVASRITVESIQEFIAGTEDEHENTWPFGFNNRYSLEGNRLTTAVEKANEKVMRAVQNRPELKGMGTTVVAALFDQDRATLVHVGDSRAYLFRRTELKRLTDDHSWVQEQVNAGILSEDEAKHHPLKNVVTRALGGAAHVAVDLIEVPLEDGDRFLLCSDGLTGLVSDEEIVDQMKAPESLDFAVRSLVDLANERGGIDNITAILVEVGTSAGDRRKTDPLGHPVDISTEPTAVSLTPLSTETTEVSLPVMGGAAVAAGAKTPAGAGVKAPAGAGEKAAESESVAAEAAAMKAPGGAGVAADAAAMKAPGGAGVAANAAVAKPAGAAGDAAAQAAEPPKAEEKPAEEAATEPKPEEPATTPKAQPAESPKADEQALLVQDETEAVTPLSDEPVAPKAEKVVEVARANGGSASSAPSSKAGGGSANSLKSLADTDTEETVPLDELPTLPPPTKRDG